MTPLNQSTHAPGRPSPLALRLLGPALVASTAAVAGAQTGSHSVWTAKDGTVVHLAPAGGTASATPIVAAVTSDGQTSQIATTTSVSDGDTKVEIVTTVSIEHDDEGNVSRDETSETKAFVGGKEIPQDRVRRSGDTIEILDESGEVMRTVTIPQMNMRHSISANALAFPGALDAARRLAGGTLGGAHPASPFHVRIGQRSQAAGATAPKVMLGITMEPPEQSLADHLRVGADEVTVVGNVTPDTPAARAGLQQYDVIVAIEGDAPASPSKLREALGAKEPGQTLNLRVLSGGLSKDVTVTLEAYDAKKLGVAPAAASPDDGAFVFELGPSMDAAATIDPESLKKLMEQLQSRIGDYTDIDLNEFFAPMGPNAPRQGTGPGFYTFQVPVPTPPATTIPPGVPHAPHAQPAAPDDRIRELEDRIRSLTEMMERLERRLAEPPPTPPAPPTDRRGRGA